MTTPISTEEARLYCKVAGDAGLWIQVVATCEERDAANASADKFAAEADHARNEAWRVTRERNDALEQLREVTAERDRLRELVEQYAAERQGRESR